MIVFKIVSILNKLISKIQAELYSSFVPVEFSDFVHLRQHSSNSQHFSPFSQSLSASHLLESFGHGGLWLLSIYGQNPGFTTENKNVELSVIPINPPTSRTLNHSQKMCIYVSSREPLCLQCQKYEYFNKKN